MSETRYCGTCIHHEWDEGPEFMCINSDSDAYGEYTMFNETCESWEGMEQQ